MAPRLRGNLWKVPASVQEAVLAVTSVQEVMVSPNIQDLSRLAQNSVQELGELVSCPLQVAMVDTSPLESRKVVETPLGSRRVVDCSQQAAMAAETPLGSRRVVDCSQQVGMAAKGCSWVSSGGAASSL